MKSTHKTNKTKHALCGLLSGLLSGLLLLAAGTAQTHAGLLVPAAPGDALYVANIGNNTIEKFTTGGVGSVFASRGLNLPEFLAFTDDAGVPLKFPNQVPEPAAWGMMALGTASLLARRRRNG